MALGDNRFDKVASDMQQLFVSQCITVQVVTSQAAQAVARDEYMRPIAAPPTPTDVQVVLTQVVENILPTPEGGRPVETIEFFAFPGTVNENDTVTWNGHEFRTSSVWPSTFGGTVQVLSCKADRLVGT